MSAKHALNRYYAKLMREQERERSPRRNSKPEHEVKVRVMHWLEANGFSCDVVESRAVYSKAAGRYVNGQTRKGFSDLTGCAPDGTAVFIELKAPGRRSTLRPEQREFLMSKIQCGAFALVVDSVHYLTDAWTEFTHRRRMDPQLARAFLLRHLPAQRAAHELTIED